MSFPTYPDYKNSGVPWLGDLPGHWDTLPLKAVCTLNPSKAEVASFPDDTELSFLPMEAISETGQLDLSRTRPISEVSSGYSYFADGDLVFAKVTPCFENGKGALMRGLIGGRGFGTTEVTVLRPKVAADAQYVRWVTISRLFRDPATGEMYGAGGLKRVPDAFVSSFKSPWPPQPERQAIAAFLDRETAKIDALVAEQDRLIALLKEKRQAVISHAVTKGLNPNAPMKDSGIEWLGEIPAHWEVRRLRFVAAIETGDADTANAIDNGEYPFFVRSPNIERINGFTHDCEAVMTAGDGAGVGKVFHHFAGKFRAHQRVYIFRNFRGVTGKWFYEYLKALFYRVVLEGTAKSTVDSLRRPMIADFPMTVPPAAEVPAIERHIAQKSAQFDALIAEAQSAITLLQERRAALISAAVTGKIDVRGLAGTSQELELA